VKSAPAKARVLIATDSVSDAEQLAGLLAAHFEHVRVSTIAANASKDFEEFGPHVLVLAFDTIAKAQVYYLGLYRLLPSLHEHPHRSILLCSKEEVPQAFELCKKQQFDDYVLYWPLAYDGLRLPMTIWSACRAMMEMAGEKFSPKAIKERVAPPVTVTVTAAATATAAPTPTRPRLLVVDDDEMLPDLVSGALDGARYDLAFATSAAEAWQMLRFAPTDLILMDLRMPGTDGISLTRQLKGSTEAAGIPIIIMTADARRETVRSSIDAGATDFLLKPFTRQSLQFKIDSILVR
jgi:CheY-like chemotaxis protein